MKKYVKAGWKGTREAWGGGDPWPLGLLAVTGLLWLVYLPLFNWIFGMAFVIAIGASLYSKGVIKGIETTQSIYDGTYVVDEPEQPTTRRDWTEDEL